MSFKILKWGRVIISLGFLILITFFFIDFTNAFSGRVIRSVLYLQFVPSLLSFLKFAGIGAAGFIFIILLNLFAGRIYCSTICPLGTFQDVIIRIKRKLTRKKKFSHQRSFNYLRYIILILSLLLFIAGLVFPLLLLDPYSNYGRIATNLFRPVLLFFNNSATSMLESMSIYSLYRVEPGMHHWLSLLWSILILLLILYFSYKHGRLFCNTLCPVGALLGWLSRFSIFKIYLNRTLCTSCGKCSAVCKAGCIDVKNKSVDFSRCVGCLNCLSSCPDNGVIFGRPGKSEKAVILPYDDKRRDLIRRSLTAMASLAGMSMLAQGRGYGLRRFNQPLPVKKEYPVSPPGSISFDHFNGSCTACHLCVNACPTHVIRPSFLEYGLAGIMQPRMDYHASYCNFDCVICSEVCPTGALRPLKAEEKHVLQLGKVIFIKQNCVVFTDNTDCGACSEHCPTKAVYMRPFRGNLFLPEVNPDICVGCGACEYACPTDPKSIYVEGNPVHLTAEKPIIKKMEQPDQQEDFPF
jgi:ferredoxin